MKKKLCLLVFSLIIIGITPLPSLAADLPNVVNINSIELQKQMDRLNEIKSIDTKTLSRHQRKELRHEIRSIQKAQSTGNGGIYLSVGAIIIIVLLLILIL
ncbi:MAG: hypothetical protein HOP30_11770 [Cyclobacteriaceae bacterium]|nr:hypothetical protein [Cyclobacteriaceae bacterium]